MIPLIFASSIIISPGLIASYFTSVDNQTVREVATFLYDALYVGRSWIFWALYFIAVVGFTFFYALVIFQQQNIGDNLQKNGAFIPGIRPGKRTSDHLNDILTRLTTVGAIYLTLVALLPQVLLSGIQVQYIPWIGTWLDSIFQSNPLTKWIPTGVGIQIYFGGTSLLIIIGVAMDTMNQVESQLIMRHYDGFLGPRGRRLRGRRSM